MENKVNVSTGILFYFFTLSLIPALKFIFLHLISGTLGVYSNNN